MRNLSNSEYKRSCEKLKSKLDKIIKHKLTEKLDNKNYEAVFAYLEKKFPNINLRSVNIYLCDSEFLESLGFLGIGGFYERINSTIIIPRKETQSKINEFEICAKLSIDEVLVHELLHYISDNIGRNNYSIELEEEFAYGNSLDYLKSKGYTNDEIIINNYLPFLYMSELLKLKVKNTKKINEKAKSNAISRGKELISVYSSEKPNNNNDNKDVESFLIFDFI